MNWRHWLARSTIFILPMDGLKVLVSSFTGLHSMRKKRNSDCVLFEVHDTKPRLSGMIFLIGYLHIYDAYFHYKGQVMCACSSLALTTEQDTTPSKTVTCMYELFQKLKPGGKIYKGWWVLVKFLVPLPKKVLFTAQTIKRLRTRQFSFYVLCSNELGDCS